MKAHAEGGDFKGRKACPYKTMISCRATLAVALIS